MARSAADVQLCGDDELDYLASRTQFEQGQGLLLDEAYRLAHLPSIAPDHPRVIARLEGRPYDMGRHESVFSLVLPIADELLKRSAAYLTLEAELKASPLAAKIAWNIVERRRHKLHATVLRLSGNGRDTAGSRRQAARRPETPRAGGRRAAGLVLRSIGGGSICAPIRRSPPD